VVLYGLEIGLIVYFNFLEGVGVSHARKLISPNSIYNLCGLYDLDIEVIMCVVLISQRKWWSSPRKVIQYSL
jgi:hypothetical protein